MKAGGSPTCSSPMPVTPRVGITRLDGDPRWRKATFNFNYRELGDPADETLEIACHFELVLAEETGTSPAGTWR